MNGLLDWKNLSSAFHRLGMDKKSQAGNLCSAS